jgi:phosphatidylglycerophosphatase A
MFQRPALPFFHPAALLATWFGCGLSRFAPGTVGSLAALPCAAGLWMLGGAWLLGLAVALAFLAGLWASARYAGAAGGGDPGAVVIDEVAGQWLTLVFLPADPRAYVLAFVLFRLFDIAKPWPIGWMDRTLEGGLGIMLDDLMAGLYAAVLSYGLWLWIG